MSFILGFFVTLALIWYVTKIVPWVGRWAYASWHPDAPERHEFYDQYCMGVVMHAWALFIFAIFMIISITIGNL